MNIYDFLAHMNKLVLSPETDWKILLGEEVYKLLDPQFSEFKTVGNEWKFNPQMDLIFNILATIYFADSDLLDSFDKAIKNISEMKI